MSHHREAHRSIHPVAIFFLAVGALLVLTLSAGLILQGGSRIFPNVSAAGVPVGGMTVPEAAQTLQSEIGGAYSQSLRLILPDKTVTLLPEKTEVSLDTEAAAKLALRFGRENGPFSAIFSYLDCLSAPYDIDVRETLRFNDAYLRSELNGIVTDANRPLTQTSAVFAAEPDRLVVRIGEPGRTVAFEPLYTKIIDAYNRADFSDILVTFEATPPAPFSLDKAFETYCKPAQNAYYDEAKKRLVPESVGYGFDLSAMQQQVNAAADGTSIEIPFTALIPEVTLEELTKQYFSDVLGSCDAPHTYNPPRTENLRLACNAINGTILNPGDVFSFNGIVGERTAEKGYQDAIVFAEGGNSEEGTGGGVCQVASAIYYAALQADLKIDQRTEHMYVVDYVPMGMDATVYWGNLDFRFVNSTEHPLAVSAEVSDGSVHIRLLGTRKPDAPAVKMTYEVLSSDPFEVVEELDVTKPVGFEEVKQTGYTGFKIKSYKHYLDKDGNELSSHLEAQSLYKRRDKIITKGPTAEQAASLAAGEAILAPDGTVLVPAQTPTTQQLPPGGGEPPAPATEQTPAAEQTPSAEQTPAAEQTPSAEQTPAAEPLPTADQIPAADPLSVVEQTPPAG